MSSHPPQYCDDCDEECSPVLHFERKGHWPHTTTTTTSVQDWSSATAPLSSLAILRLLPTPSSLDASKNFDLKIHSSIIDSHLYQAPLFVASNEDNVVHVTNMSSVDHLEAEVEGEYTKYFVPQRFHRHAVHLGSPPNPTTRMPYLECEEAPSVPSSIIIGSNNYPHSASKLERVYLTSAADGDDGTFKTMTNNIAASSPFHEDEDGGAGRLHELLSAWKDMVEEAKVQCNDHHRRIHTVGTDTVLDHAAEQNRERIQGSSWDHVNGEGKGSPSSDFASPSSLYKHFEQVYLEAPVRATSASQIRSGDELYNGSPNNDVASRLEEEVRGASRLEEEVRGASSIRLFTYSSRRKQDVEVPTVTDDLVDEEELEEIERPGWVNRLGLHGEEICVAPGSSPLFRGRSFEIPKSQLNVSDAFKMRGGETFLCHVEEEKREVEDRRGSQSSSELDKVVVDVANMQHSQKAQLRAQQEVDRLLLQHGVQILSAATQLEDNVGRNFRNEGGESLDLRSENCILVRKEQGCYGSDGSRTPSNLSGEIKYLPDEEEKEAAAHHVEPVDFDATWSHMNDSNSIAASPRPDSSYMPPSPQNKTPLLGRRYRPEVTPQPVPNVDHPFSEASWTNSVPHTQSHTEQLRQSHTEQLSHPLPDHPSGVTSTKENGRVGSKTSPTPPTAAMTCTDSQADFSARVASSTENDVRPLPAPSGGFMPPNLESFSAHHAITSSTAQRELEKPPATAPTSRPVIKLLSVDCQHVSIGLNTMGQQVDAASSSLLLPQKEETPPPAAAPRKQRKGLVLSLASFRDCAQIYLKTQRSNKISNPSTVETIRQVLSVALSFSKAVQEFSLNHSFSDGRPTVTDADLVNDSSYSDLLSTVQLELESVTSTLCAQRLLLDGAKLVESDLKTSLGTSSMESTILRLTNYLTDVYEKFNSIQKNCRSVEVVFSVLSNLELRYPMGYLDSNVTHLLSRIVSKFLQRLNSNGNGGLVADDLSQFPTIPERTIVEHNYNLLMSSSSGSGAPQFIKMLETLRKQCMKKSEQARLPQSYASPKSIGALLIKECAPPHSGNMPVVAQDVDMAQVIGMAMYSNDQVVNKRMESMYTTFGTSQKKISVCKQEALEELCSLVVQYQGVSQELMEWLLRFVSAQQVAKDYLERLRAENGKDGNNSTSTLSYMESLSTRNTEMDSQLNENAKYLSKRSSMFQVLVVEIELLRKLDQVPLQIPPHALLAEEEPSVQAHQGYERVDDRLTLLSQAARANSSFAKRALIMLGNFVMASLEGGPVVVENEDAIKALSNLCEAQEDLATALYRAKRQTMVGKGKTNQLVNENSISIPAILFKDEKRTTAASQQHSVVALADLPPTIQLFGPSSSPLPSVQAFLALSNIRLLQHPGILVYMYRNPREKKDGVVRCTLQLSTDCLSLLISPSTTNPAELLSSSAGEGRSMVRVVSLPEVEMFTRGQAQKLGGGVSSVQTLRVHYETGGSAEILFTSFSAFQEWSDVLQQLLSNKSRLSYLPKTLEKYQK